MGESENAEQKATFVGIRKRSVKITENKMDEVSGNTLKCNGLEEPGEKCSEESSPDSISSNDVESNVTLLRQTAIQEVKDSFLKKQRLSKQTERQMTETIDQLIEQLEAIYTPKRFLSLITGGFNPRPQREKSPNDQSTGKVFLPRNSVLTDLLEINNYQTLYNILVSILLVLFLKTVAHDIVETGSINLDFQMIRWAFGNLRTVVTIWVAMMLCTLAIVYPAFNTWAHSRNYLGNNPLWLRIWDGVWLIGYLAYISLVIFVPAREVAAARLPPASAMIVILEQLRLFMKTHAFVRSNIPRARSFKLNSAKLTVSVEKDGEEDQDADSPCPDFSKYLYFVFAPTLIYSDSYPRTKRIRWSWVARNFAQVLGIIFYFYFIFVRYFVPAFRQFGSADGPFTAKDMILPIFGCMMPGVLVLVCVFFCLLHSWLNAHAEMLRFADRMFYKDWWNSTSYAGFFRTWNVIVHDWLYTYVYKDVRELCGRGNRVLPMLVVFAFSSGFHEYVVTFTYHNFNPVHLVMFGGFGTMFSCFTAMERIPRFGNIFLWVTLIMGSGLLLSIYAIEFYARINCPPTLDPWLDFFVPRSWTCRNI